MPLTSGPHQHFFGYYDKCPWNHSGRYVLAHQAQPENRPPSPADTISVGLIDLHANNRFEPLAQSCAWNWQQGTMLQWLPGTQQDTIIYNDRRDGQFVAVIRVIASDSERILPRPVAALSRDGKLALSLNFARLARERPGYGYEGIPDAFDTDMAAHDDGIYLIDIQTGDCRFIISLADIARRCNADPHLRSKHWFNHVLFSPNGKRFIFLHRWQTALGSSGRPFLTEMYTAALDGADLFCLNPHEMTSHFDWRDDNQVIAFAHQPGAGDKYYLFTDRTRQIEPIGDQKLTSLYDGHCSFSPDGKWILTDTYPDKARQRHLLIYDPLTDQRIDLGRFYEPPYSSAQLRCDLHPRFSRDGSQVCFDSAHTGTRQMYTLDISQLI